MGGHLCALPELCTPSLPVVSMEWLHSAQARHHVSSVKRANVPAVQRGGQAV